MSMSLVTQRQSLHWTGSVPHLIALLARFGKVEHIEGDKHLKLFDCIDLSFEGIYVFFLDINKAVLNYL